MNRKILFTGTPESGKDELLEYVLSHDNNVGKRFNVYNLEKLAGEAEFPEGGIADGDSEARMSRIASMQANFEGKLRSLERKLVKERKNIILNSPITKETPMGVVPLMTEEFMKAFEPDIIILVESAEDDVSVRMINRNHAARISEETRAILKIIPLEKGNFKKSLKEIVEVMEETLV